MLHAISWLQFSIFLLLCLLAYYGYVGIRYYRKELSDLLRGKGGRSSRVGAADAVSASDADSDAMGDDEQDQTLMNTTRNVLDKYAGDGNDERLAEDVRADVSTAYAARSARAQDAPVQFKSMEKVIALLQQVMDEGVAVGMGQADLEDGIGKVLSGCRHLKGTPYQVAIDNFVIRNCLTHFSFTVTERDVGLLWQLGE